MVAGECPDHRAPRGARSPRSVNEQQRRRLPRAVVDHMHPVRMLNVVTTHARDDTGPPAVSLGQMSAPRSIYSRRAEKLARQNAARCWRWPPERGAASGPPGLDCGTVVAAGLAGVRDHVGPLT